MHRKQDLVLFWIQVILDVLQGNYRAVMDAHFPDDPDR